MPSDKNKSGFISRIKSAVRAFAAPSGIANETGVDADVARLIDDSGFSEYKNFDDLIQRKGYSIYRDMMKDANVSHCIYNKRVAVVTAEYDILPATDSPIDLEIARFMQFNFDKMFGTIASAMFEVLSAVVYGHSISEMNFVVESGKNEFSGKWRIKNIRNKNPKDFAPILDEYGNIVGLDLIDQNGNHVPISNWQSKYIIYTYCGEFGRHFGDSDLRAVYKHWWSKDFLLKWWNIYLERYGAPTRVGKYPAGNATVKSKLKEILRDIVNNTAITIPDDMTIDFIQAAEKGDFSSAINYHDTQITKKILGSTLTTDVGSQVGSFAQAKEHRATSEMFIDFLRQDIADVVINDRIFRTLVELNYGVDALVPKFIYRPTREEIKIKTVQDIQLLADRGLLTMNDIKVLRSRMDLPSAKVFDTDPDAIFKAASAKSDDPAMSDDRVEESPEAAEPEAEVKAEQPKPEVAKLAKKTDREPVTSNNVDSWKPHRDLTSPEIAVGGVSYLQKQLKKQVKAEDAIVEGSRPIFESMQLDILKYIESKVLVDGEASAAAMEKFVTPPKQLKEFKKLVNETVRKIVYGEYDTALKTGKCNSKGIPKFDENNLARTNISVDFVPPANVKKKMKEWEADGNWVAMKNWREQHVASVSGTLETVANTKIVSYIDRRIVESVHNAITDGIMGGGGIKEITKLLNKSFEQIIARGEAVDPKLQSAPSLERVVRTTVNRAFNDAHRAAWNDPEILEDYPYLEYSAIMDDATSEICEELDGKIYRTDDPVWDSITPPNHPYCRSDTIPVAIDDDAVKDGTSKPPDLSKIPESFGGTKE